MVRKVKIAYVGKALGTNLISTEFLAGTDKDGHKLPSHMINPYALGYGVDSAGMPGLKYRVCNRVDENGNPHFKAAEISRGVPRRVGYDLFGNPLHTEEREVLSYRKILENTGGEDSGIKRRWAADKNVKQVDLICEALKSSGFLDHHDVEELGGALVGTVTHKNNKTFAATGPYVQAALGISRRNFYTSDVNSACAGFLRTVDWARMRLEDTQRPIEERQKDFILAGGCELLTGGVIDFSQKKRYGGTDYSEINCDLFSDGAGIVVLQLADNDLEGILGMEIGNFSGGVDFIQRDKYGFVRMPNGHGVFDEGTKIMQETLIRLMNRLSVKDTELDLIIPQMANGRMLKRMKKTLAKVYPCLADKVFFDMDDGNKSSANAGSAIYNALQQDKIRRSVFRDGRLVRMGSKVAILDLGAGLSFGGAIVQF